MYRVIDANDDIRQWHKKSDDDDQQIEWWRDCAFG